MPPKSRQANVPPPQIARPAPHEDSDEEDEEEEFDLVAAMNDMSLHERRKIYALKGLHAEFLARRAALREESRALEKEAQERIAVFSQIRKDIVNGVRDVTDEEIALAAANKVNQREPVVEKDKDKKKKAQVVSPEDAKEKAVLARAAEDPKGGIPSFWLTALSNSEPIDALITERDREALRLLTDVRSAFIDDEPEKGLRIFFDFDAAANTFFTNPTLTKTYHMTFNEDSGEMEIDTVEGCTINWTSPEKNLTVEIKQKKQRNKNTKQVRVVSKEEKVDSFFNFFSPPKDPNEASEDGSEDEYAAEFYEQEMEADIEVFQALTEEVVPKAASFYSGRIVDEVARMLQAQFGFGLDDNDDDEEEESEEDDDDEAAGPNAFKNMVGGRGGRGNGNSGNRGGRGGAPQQQECKQQ